jgi:hypothetical protein
MVDGRPLHHPVLPWAAAVSAADTGCPDTSAWPLFRSTADTAVVSGSADTRGFQVCGECGDPRWTTTVGMRTSTARARPATADTFRLRRCPGGQCSSGRRCRADRRCPLPPPACPAGRRTPVAGATATSKPAPVPVALAQAAFMSRGDGNGMVTSEDPRLATGSVRRPQPDGHGGHQAADTSQWTRA